MCSAVAPQSQTEQIIPNIPLWTVLQTGKVQKINLGSSINQYWLLSWNLTFMCHASPVFFETKVLK